MDIEKVTKIKTEKEEKGEIMGVVRPELWEE